MTGLRELLDPRPDLRPYLFCRGFLVTDRPLDTSAYPFYGNWKETAVGSLWVYVHRRQKLTVAEHRGKTLFLIGHAYDPFAMEHEESAILVRIAERGLDAIHELTGVFFLGILCGAGLELHVDASAQQWACYGRIGGHLYVSSHMRLIGDLLDLRMTEYADRLVHYRWYRYMMGNYLPGDITCFDELTRIVPNTFVRYDGIGFTVTRFYPAQEIAMCETEAEYRAVIAEAAEIMKNTMALIPQKWPRPAISLTGGIDSGTTFAAANGQYDRYTAFSYVSLHRESVDAEKAEEICARFHVPWKRYDVPERNADVADLSSFKQILEWNEGGIGSIADSDVRKKVTLIRSDVCDVEVKSWVSETVRAYAHRYFGRRSFPKDLSARNYTSLYKIFTFDRRLARETDRRFQAYWEHTRLKEHLFNYDETDLFVWEMMHGGKCALSLGAMKTCFDITIPYNNRKLLDLLLRVPLEKRLSDQHHLDMKRLLNEELYGMNIRVVNLNETDLRKRLADLYFTIHSALPF